jgi:carbon-monoxide dehydrogenase large subunit
MNDWIGRDMPRREDGALLRGMGWFVDDITPAGCFFLEMVRSPFGAGHIAALDVGAARAVPGVVAAYTAV